MIKFWIIVNNMWLNWNYPEWHETCKLDKLVAKFYSLKSQSFDLKYKFCGSRFEIEETQARLQQIGNHVKVLRTKETKSHSHIIEIADIEHKLETLRTDVVAVENQVNKLENSNKEWEKEIDSLNSYFQERKNVIEHDKLINHIGLKFNTTQSGLNEIHIKLSDLEQAVNNIERHLRGE